MGVASGNRFKGKWDIGIESSGFSLSVENNMFWIEGQAEPTTGDRYNVNVGEGIGMGRGICILGGTSIRNNVCIDRYGFGFAGIFRPSSACVVTQNNVRGFRFGIATGVESGVTRGNVFVGQLQIIGNVVDRSRRHGIMLAHSSRSRVHMNVVTGCGTEDPTFGYANIYVSGETDITQGPRSESYRLSVDNNLVRAVNGTP